MYQECIEAWALGCSGSWSLHHCPSSIFYTKELLLKPSSGQRVTLNLSGIFSHQTNPIIPVFHTHPCKPALFSSARARDCHWKLSLVKHFTHLYSPEGSLWWPCRRRVRAALGDYRWTEKWIWSWTGAQSNTNNLKMYMKANPTDLSSYW